MSRKKEPGSEESLEERLRQPPEVRIVSLEEFVPDCRNANLGTPAGQQLIRTSLEKRGAGRSILVDRDGEIIAGNKTAREALAAGFRRVIVVPTQGDELVAVERQDLSLKTDADARLLAYDDNRANEIDLRWDLEQISVDRGALGEEMTALFSDEDMAKLEEQAQLDTTFLEEHLAAAQRELGEAGRDGAEDGWGQRAGGAGGASPLAAGMVQLIFVLTPGDRDAIVDKLRRTKNEHELTTNAEALLYALGIG